MLKIHLGSGPHCLEGWDNLDLLNHPGVIRHDLTRPLPYADNSVDFAFSEHFLEHLTREQGLAFLKEVRRVLKPGGVFRIVMPDLQKLAQDYLECNVKTIPGVWEPKSPCQMLNEGLRLWGHLYVYDAIEAMTSCIEAGYTLVKWQHYKQSAHPELQNLEIRPFNDELIFEVTK